jgi:pyruvate dehydrogenase E2 component (dihydrolipoamide acetyltransferase)
MIHEVILPQLGQTMTEGTIVKWLVAEGDSVKKGDILFQVESDKAVLESEAMASGQVLRLLHPEGSKLPVLTVIALIGEPSDDVSAYAAGDKAAPSAEALARTMEAEEQLVSSGQAAKEPVASVETVVGRILASPRARRVAKELGVDLKLVSGSGPKGRIVEDDVLAYLEGLTVEAVPPEIRPVRAEAPAAPAQSLASGSAIPLTGVRAVIAERMATSAQTTARVTLTAEADAIRLVEARTQLKEAYAESLGFSIGYNDLLIAICARALREHSNVNSRLEGDHIRLLDEVHIGLAVDTARGLLVPVVRNADRLGVVEIAQRVRDVVGRAREGRSTPDELGGGTFTITNLGMYGIDAFTPIINLPECAILGVGRIRPRPVVVGENITVGQQLWLSLTFDHRIVDGGPAARFLQRIVELVEEPFLLLA